MATIHLELLLGEIGEVLRRAEAGERLTITVSGRPVAELGPLGGERWVSGERLREIWRTDPPRGLGADLERMPVGLADSLEHRG